MLSQRSLWLNKFAKEKTDKKFVNPEKQFWSDQLRKAHNVHGMTYRRFDGSGTGIVGAKYTVEEKSSALLQTSEIQYYSTVPVIISLQNDETMIKSFDHLDGGKRGLNGLSYDLIIRYDNFEKNLKIIIYGSIDLLVALN